MVQADTGIRTRQLIHYWIGEVAFLAHRHGEPLLSSLVVSSEGEVGEGYAKAVLDVYGPPPPRDLQRHAAEERLRCYRYFGATLPADGGTPQLTRQVAEGDEMRPRGAEEQRCRPPTALNVICSSPRRVNAIAAISPVPVAFAHLTGRDIETP